MSKPPLVVPGITRREIIISIVAALAVIAFIALGVMKMGDRIIVNKLSGVIELKTFNPRGEDQVTFGKKGIETLRIEGEYILEVRSGGVVYLVPVEKHIYDSKKVGDSFTFTNPDPKK
jgi:hypothetical protein